MSPDEYKGSRIRLAERNKRTETQQSSPAGHDFASVLFICFYLFFKKVFFACEDLIRMSKTKQARVKLNGHTFSFIPLLKTRVVVEYVSLYV